MKRLEVADRRQPAVRHHLRLVAVGQDVGDVVAQHVARLVGDQRRGVEDVALGGVLLLDRLQFLGRVLAEQVLEQLVQAGAVLDRAVGGAPLVEHRHRGAVGLGLLDRVAVDELAEDLVGALLLAHDDRRAGEADARAVGQPGQQVGVQVAGLGAVRLVHQHEDAVVLVQHLELLAGLVAGLRLFHLRQIVRRQRRIARRVGVAVLLDRGEDQPRPLAPRQRLHARRAVGHLHHLAGQRGGHRELALQVLAVGDDDDLEAPQLRVRAHLAHQEHHGQALARALGVPDDAAALVVLAVLQRASCRS